MWYVVQRRQVFVIQSVPGIHAQAQRVRLLRAGNQPLHFRKFGGVGFPAGRFIASIAPPFRKLLRELAGMQLNELATGAC
jgi:hypothetical protein